jgi:hypothetical protein
VPTDRSRPDEDAIRRALAECMTVNDIDDAMGWPPGTARRRRWRAPDRGGLPNADAELAGTALWFRSTIEAWQLAPTRRPRRPTGTPEPEPPDGTPPDETPPEGTPPEGTPPGAATEQGDGEPGDGGADTPALDPTVDRTAPPDPVPPPDPAEGTTNGADGGPAQASTSPADPEPDDAPAPAPPLDAPSAASSGFDLAVGQRVVAEVRGGWRDAVIAHRDRSTVVVEYQLADGPLGVRRQRIGIDRVRIPPED